MAEFPGYSTRIMITEETDDWVRWRVACGCDSPTHDWTFDIEWDKDINEVMMYVYLNVWCTKDRYHRRRYWEWLTNFYRRCKLALRLLFTGHLEFDADLMFKQQSDVRDLAIALLETIRVMNERKVVYGDFQQPDNPLQG